MPRSPLITVLLAAIAALMLAGCGLQPLRTLKQLRDALQARDEAQVAALVDFEQVRAASRARVEQRLDQANQGKLLGGLRAALADRVAEGVIERLTTPRGLIGWVCDQSLKPPPSPPPPCRLQSDLTQRQSVGEDGYRADLTLADGKSVTLMLKRQSDGRWRVVDIVMSPESFEQLRQSVAD